MQKIIIRKNHAFRSNDAVREFGYPEKWISEQCSMIGFDGIERNMSTLFEACIRNYSRMF